MLHIIPLRALICRARTRLENVIVEYVNNSKINPIIYIGDGGTGSIIVWNIEANEGYKVKLPRSSTVRPPWSDEKDQFFLIMIENSKSTYIYYTYFSSVDVFKVRTKDLQKRINPKCVINIGRKPCKMVILGSAYGTVVYFRVKGLNILYSWDTKYSFLEENIMVVNSSILNTIIIDV